MTMNIASTDKYKHMLTQLQAHVQSVHANTRAHLAVCEVAVTIFDVILVACIIYQPTAVLQCTVSRSPQKMVIWCNCRI